MRSDSRPQATVRLLEPTDLTRPFDGYGGLAGRVSMEILSALNEPASGRVVLVAEYRDLIVGAIALEFRPGGLHIEILTRNGAAGNLPGLQVGTPLLQAAERLGRDRGRRSSPWRAIDDPSVVAFYRRAGFRESGPPFDEPGWGFLLPMRRPLPPPP